MELGVRDQHLLAFGDTRSGKTTLLRGIVRSLLERSSPDELVLAVMDIRGDIVREIPEAYLGGQASTAAEAVIDYLRSMGCRDDEMMRVGMDAVTWRGAVYRAVPAPPVPSPQ